MKSRQNRAKILKVIEDNPSGLSAKTLSLEVNVPLRTVHRLLNELVDLKAIIKKGKAKNIEYYSASSFTAQYNESFLADYKPNKTNFFTQEELQFFNRIGRRRGTTAQLETYNTQIYERLIIDLSWSSSKLEGNTYSLLETERLIVENKEAAGKDLIETQMILNHKEAIKFITLNYKEMDINSLSIKSIHGLLSENLLKNHSAIGELRQIPVRISGTRYLPINDPHVLKKQFDLFLKKVKMIKNPFEQSFFVFVFIPYLQLFEDLNKRTARIGCNIPLLKFNCSPISFLNITTEEYIKALIEVYEFNDVHLLKNIFIKAYQNSANEYSAIKVKLQTPDPLLVKYRVLIKESVKKIVLDEEKITSLKFVNLPKNEKQFIIDTVKLELNNLTEGSLVRFGLKPSDLKKYKKIKRPV